MISSQKGRIFREALQDGVEVNEETAIITAQGQSVDDYTLSRIAGRGGRDERP